jgi:glycosyltransferase involved in cell wall biosynthesis
LKKHGLDAVTITPGVDLKKFKPRRSTPKTRDVLFIGNFAHKDKGLDYLIEAVQMIPDTRLVVVGNGSQITQPQVSYTGVLHDDKLVKRIQASRVLVLPSITDSESFGMVLLEAMACGVPAIGSDIGGIPTVIDNGKTGLLVPPCDVSGLAEAITSLLHKPDHADRLSKNAYQKVLQKFNWDSSIQAYLNLLDDVQGRTAS